MEIDMITTSKDGIIVLDFQVVEHLPVLIVPMFILVYQP